MSLGLILWAGRGVDPTAVLALLRSASPGWLLLAAALVPLEVWLAAERWRIGADGLGMRLGRWEATREYALSTWLNQVLPGGVAGDAVRVWRTRRDGAAVATGAALLDRALGLGVLLIVVVIGLLAWPSLHPGLPRPPGVLPVAAALLGGIVGIGLVGGGVIAGLRRALSPVRAVKQVALSLALTAALLVAFACCGRALGLPLGALVLTAIPLLLLAMSVPISVGGWGLREATATALLPTLGWSSEAALALSATYGLTVLVGSLPGALVWLSDPVAQGGDAPTDPVEPPPVDLADVDAVFAAPPPAHRPEPVVEEAR